MNLGFEIEKKAIRIVQTTALPCTLTSAKGVVLYCLRDSNQKISQ
jgi:hypothetical protein